MIAGHATSVTMETVFWDDLKRIAKARGLSLNAIVTEIDSKKAPDMNLSSALRVYILNFVKVELNSC